LVLAGVRPGDGVIVPPLTFIGTSNPILYCGAKPILLDVRESDGTLDPEALATYLRDGTSRSNGVLRDRATGATLRAILPVHLYGAPAEMARISALAGEAGLAVVEDAAESLGSVLDGRACGSFGLIGCLSFNGNKIITTGGGGMIVTSDEQLARRGRHLSTQARIDLTEYRHDEVGYNYRLTNIQAALGLGQLDTFPQRLERKRAMAALYRQRLAGLPLRFLEPRAAVTIGSQRSFLSGPSSASRSLRRSTRPESSLDRSSCRSSTSRRTCMSPSGETCRCRRSFTNVA